MLGLPRLAQAGGGRIEAAGRISATPNLESGRQVGRKSGGCLEVGASSAFWRFGKQKLTTVEAFGAFTGPVTIHDIVPKILGLRNHGFVKFGGNYGDRR